MIPFLRPVIPNSQNLMNDRFAKILDSGIFVFGENTSEFETAIRDFCEVDYAVSLSSCSHGLILLMSQVDADVVILPAFTFSATGQGVFWNSHLKFAFADVDESGLLSPETLEPVIRRYPGAAVLAVHMYGNPCDVKGLQEVTERYGGTLYFDSAHGLGAEVSGKSLGSSGRAEVFSLGVTKCLPCGEGGVLTTNDRSLAEKISRARIHGKVNSTLPYESSLDTDINGLNARGQEFNAALGCHLLPYLPDFIRRRNEIANSYRDAFGDRVISQVLSSNTCSYKDFAIRAGTCRSEKLTVARRLLEHGIQTKEYYYPTIPKLQSVEILSNRNVSLTTSFPVAEKLAETALALPIYPDLSEKEVSFIIDAVLESLSQ